jgi:dolichyl-diphosphooligosaccharide--protein glycosyltransferase
MVDWQMVSPYSKFNAPVTFYSGNETAQDFNRAIYQQTEQGGFRTVMQLRTQRYHESQMVRLYEHYGSAVDPQPVVVDWEPQAARNADGERIEVATLPSDLNATVQRFDNVSAARAYVEEDGSAQVGGVGTLPSERVDALEHYRLVHATDARGQDPTGRQVNVLSQLGVSPGDLFGEPAQTLFSDDFVKTFERVPGATIEGSGAEPGTEVRAAVRMEKPTGETFVYQQYAEADANGEFEFRVPYSTTGYDEYGPEEGYTNTSVRATGPYEVTTGVASGGGGAVPRADRVNVTEAQVIGEDDAAATVELEPLIPEDGGDDSGNETDGGGNETAAIDAPADSGVPAATALSSTAPVDTAPIDTAPVDTAPIDTAPIDAATPGVARALPRTVP